MNLLNAFLDTTQNWPEDSAIDKRVVKWLSTKVGSLFFSFFFSFPLIKKKKTNKHHSLSLILLNFKLVLKKNAN